MILKERGLEETVGIMTVIFDRIVRRRKKKVSARRKGGVMGKM